MLSSYTVVKWKKQKWVCSSNGRVIPSQGIGNGIDARLIQLFFFFSLDDPHAICMLFRS